MGKLSTNWFALLEDGTWVKHPGKLSKRELDQIINKYIQKGFVVGIIRETGLLLVGSEEWLQQMVNKYE